MRSGPRVLYRKVDAFLAQAVGFHIARAIRAQVHNRDALRHALRFCPGFVPTQATRVAT